MPKSSNKWIVRGQRSFYTQQQGVSIRSWMFVLMMSFCLSQSGCALIQLPLQAAGAAIDFASKMPIPPPWMF